MDWRHSSHVECLLCKHEALSSKASPTKTKRESIAKKEENPQNESSEKFH
jgi:hypothetical protein